MKKLLIVLPLLFLFGCLTTSEVYLPHTSRIFHKKNCVGLNDPNPIKYPSAQAALSSGGVSPCSICIKTNKYVYPSNYNAGYNQYTPPSYNSSYTQFPSHYSNHPTSNQNSGQNLFGDSVSGGSTFQTTPNYGTSGTSTNISGTTFHNFDSVSGTSTKIGSTTFHNFSDGTSRTSTNIGGTTFHNVDGNSVTSTNIGGY